MPNQGFLIKFDGKDAERCFVCKFDYDDYSYEINNKTKKPIPPGTTKIDLEVANKPGSAACPALSA